MSGPKISELPAVVGRVPLASQFPLNDGGATRTATLPQLWRTRHPGYRAGLHYVINGGAAATGGVAEIAAADTQLQQWRGNIYQRSTRYVKAR